MPSQLFYGGDYNPEQWSKDVWLEDMRLMREAGVNLVTLGVFSWATIEVADGVFEFGWLDEIIELLHENGIGVDLATATASPPAWLTIANPEVLPVNYSGTRLSHGGRQGYCISSPIYKAKTGQLAAKLAERYGKHPAIKMWHVNNEYGCHNPICYCDVSASAWRVWLQRKYSDLDALNKAWGTNFWSQRYHQWAEILPPRETPVGTYPNPTMVLDYRRFSNDEILSLYVNERDAIRAIDSSHPITTNFMSMKHTSVLDYWQWASEVDFVATDHYLIAEDERNFIDLAFQADLTRGFAGGKPWLLMEHSTSAVNWQDRNLPKARGEMLANSLSHVARGSNGAMFFQWRQSISGSEKFHSAMVPHTGEQSRVWKNVKELGGKLGELTELASAETEAAEVAMIFDYQSWWALSQRNLPSTSIDYPELAHDWYRALWDLGVRVDFVAPGSTAQQLAKYKMVLAPMLYLLDSKAEQELIHYSENGGYLVASYFTGISDEVDAVKLGGYGGKLVRDCLGVFVDEFAPVRVGESVHLSNGMSATEWSQFASVTSASLTASFVGGVADGSAAIAQSTTGTYVGTRLDDDSNLDLFHNIVNSLGILIRGGGGVEVIRRGQLEIAIDHNTNSVSWSKND
ncbi:MAG: beta-galactosidase [Rhodoluna sp.]|nr:beta-galactosidase [Rhodoluna sp.]